MKIYDPLGFIKKFYKAKNKIKIKKFKIKGECYGK